MLSKTTHFSFKQGCNSDCRLVYEDSVSTPHIGYMKYDRVSSQHFPKSKTHHTVRGPLCQQASLRKRLITVNQRVLSQASRKQNIREHLMRVVRNKPVTGVLCYNVLPPLLHNATSSPSLVRVTSSFIPSCPHRSPLLLHDVNVGCMNNFVCIQMKYTQQYNFHFEITHSNELLVPIVKAIYELRPLITFLYIFLIKTIPRSDSFDIINVFL